MPGAVQVTKTGPRTYIPADNEVIAGGQLVEARAGGRIGVAAAGSLKVLGVALTDAIAPEDVVTTATVAAGRPLLVGAVLPTTVAVAYGGIEVPVTYAAAANFGDALVAASAGRVTPAGANPDTRTIVGRCSAPNGVTSAQITAGGAAAVALMRTA